MIVISKQMFIVGLTVLLAIISVLASAVITRR
mgnify:CR=1 FL=1